VSRAVGPAALAAALLVACAGPRALPSREPGTPWGRWAAAEEARRALDPAAEARELLALVDAAPRHALARAALGRLDDLADLATPIARDVDRQLAALLSGGRLEGLAAFRARATRADVLSAAGEHGAAAALRAENGVVAAWTLLGPLGAYHALDLDRPFAPERGALPARTAGAPGVGEVAARTLPAPDGTVSLDGEPPTADVWYLVADVTVARGGDYLAMVGSTGSFRAWLDGEPLAARSAHEARAPLARAIPRRLAPGTHRLLVKLARGTTRGELAVALARADGAPSDATAVPAAPETAAPAARAGPFPTGLFTLGEVAAALERDGGPLAARVVAAADGAVNDREGAKRLLAEARERPAPPAEAAALEEVAARIAIDDPTLPTRIARARAEAALGRALALDPDHAAARLELARLALEAERQDDALAHLDQLPPAAAERPLALLVRARLEAARGLRPAAERHAAAAHRAAGLCGAAELLLEGAGRRDAFALQDELAQAVGRCPGGAGPLADHLRRRGDARGAIARLEAEARAAPARLEVRSALATALLAAGDAAGAAREWRELARLWPRDPRVEKRLAEGLDEAGDRPGARAARERALALDGSDLSLRRALAADAGAEPLDDLAEDGAAALAAYRAAAPAEETSSVYVLDAAATEVHPDGSQTERVHQIVKVRDARAADRHGEVALPPGAQVLTLRTVKRDGRVLEPQEGASERGAVSLPGLEPGDFAEWEYLRGVPARGAQLPGFATDGFLFAGDSPLWRSRFVVRAPAAAQVEVEARGLPPPPVVRVGDSLVVRAAADEAPAVLPEPSAPDESEYLPVLRVGAGAGPLDLGRALGDGFLDRTRPTTEIEALAREILASVPEAERGGEALLRAAQARVVAAVTGRGGSIAEPASHVLARGGGSRTVLLAAVLRALGVDARLALVREFGGDPATPRFPRGDLSGRPVLRASHGGATTWLDPSLQLAPFGVLPAAARDAEVLVVAVPGGDAELARTPGGDPADPRSVDLEIALAADGSAVVEGVETYRGWEAAAAKAAIERIDAAGRAQAVEGALARSFRALTLESLAIEGEKEAGAPLVLRWRARVASWARLEGTRASAELPLFPARLGAQYAQRARRETPLLVASAEDETLRVRVALPPGWRAVPQPRALEAPHGALRREDRALPGELVREERFTLARARIAPDAYPGFAAFANAVDAAQAAPIVLERAGPPVTPE
jgi:hypothetical protein